MSGSASLYKVSPTSCVKKVCGFRFAGRITRKESGLWVCNLCSEEYKVLRTLKKHIARHYAAVSNQCSECKTSFKSMEELENHKSQHISSSLVVAHTCELCYKTFQLDHLLKKHITFEHYTGDKRSVLIKSKNLLMSLYFAPIDGPIFIMFLQYLTSSNNNYLIFYLLQSNCT